MKGFVGFLEGKNPEYPVQALQTDLGFRAEECPGNGRRYYDSDTRLADYLMGFNPVATSSDESDDGRISGG